MGNNIIFFDFENVQSVKEEHLNKNTDIIILVGLDQDKKAFQYAETKFKKVSSVNLIKVDGQGDQALDFFLVFYLGTFYEKIKDKNIFVYLYSDDKGYKYLINHLKGKGITIETVGKPVKNTAIPTPKKPKAKSKPVETNESESYDKILKNIAPKTKKGSKRPRPKTIKGLITSIAGWLKLDKNKDKNKIESYIERLKNDNKIKLVKNSKTKIEYEYEVSSEVENTASPVRVILLAEEKLPSDGEKHFSAMKLKTKGFKFGRNAANDR